MFGFILLLFVFIFFWWAFLFEIKKKKDLFEQEMSAVGDVGNSSSGNESMIDELSIWYLNIYIYIFFYESLKVCPFVVGTLRKLICGCT